MQRQELPNGDYALSHTAATYLVNAQSTIQLAYPDSTPPEDITADLRSLA